MSDKLTKEILDRLCEPFPAEVIQWKPSATWQRDGKYSALAVPFVDLRYYYDRLNEVIGGNWSDEIVPVGDNRLIVRLTICGSTRCDVGESGKGDNAFTTAYAQGFKRVCVHFGLGAHLYTSIPQTVVPYDPERKRITREGFETLKRVALEAIKKGDHRPVEPPEDLEHIPQVQHTPTPAPPAETGKTTATPQPIVVNSPQALLEYAKSRGHQFAGVSPFCDALGLTGWPGPKDADQWNILIGKVDALGQQVPS